MPRNPRLQDRYPNGDGIFTPLRELSSAELDAQIQRLIALAQHHDEHAQALIEYRDHVFDRSRHGR
ncbi:hypothetical protein [Pseudomonas sp. CGJS7]|uniref:hypothetical protein n=1 Tax=Pseudomonas sp. CGJS7 TaxID=3109348 RepID=UPI00300A58C8